ncbi:DUF47 family protein [Horticoccus luteus]|uniref:DUF47 family protein n=1 Tax=Horticoccus luteus TaxID=2862869 RepID=A0A8F9TTT4_9BACT|nr:DUF47 family protein [Horticoccus luteus]QYM77967.1 DUF47 family protein [Horticoccus luteus]
MFSLKKLFGKDEKFFDLLEAGADEARVSIGLLVRYLQDLRAGVAQPSLDNFVQSRRKEKRIRYQMNEELSRTFVTPLEREDIEALSFALYRIPKSVEKIVERISIYPGHFPHAAFQRQAELLTTAAEAVEFMVKQLRKGTTMEKIREANDRLQYAEGEADKVMLGLLRELYHGPADAKEIVILQELYELVERAVDRCRNAGVIVVQIVLKHA